MKTITYNFCDQITESQNFYIRLEQLTDKIIYQASELIPYAIDFMKHTGKEACSIQESRQHYLMELISIGVYWENYISKSLHKSKILFAFAKRMNNLRTKYPDHKKRIDYIRGFLNTQLKKKSSGIKEIVCSTENFRNLIKWMEASGDYPQTISVLRRWESFLNDQTAQIQYKILSLAKSFSHRFEAICNSYLENHFKYLPDFLNNFENRYNHREDILFCGRPKNEYYLNIIGACIMNRDLKQDFVNTSKKVILLPTCLRNNNESCAAVQKDNAFICQGCKKDCHVNRIKQTVKNEVEILMVPHTSNFEKELISQSGNKNTGYIGVACVLNLLEGGYAMKKLGLPAQCVFLDYCGCKNHWDQKGIPTDLNKEHLKHICKNTRVIESLPIE